MSVRVFIREGCNGMGTCARLAPAVFGLNANGLAEILVDDADEHKESILRAA